MTAALRVAGCSAALAHRVGHGGFQAAAVSTIRRGTESILFYSVPKLRLGCLYQAARRFKPLTATIRRLPPS